MRLLIIGCEYAGKKTLASGISKWMIEAMGLRLVRWHNHFVVPELDGHLSVQAEGEQRTVGKTESDLNSAEDEAQILSLRPSVLEQLQRHSVWRHLHPDMFREDDTLFINHYYAEAVYAPIYYGYGEPGSFADRRGRARAWDAELLALAPDTVLVLLRASVATIQDRMRASPRIRGILKEADVGLVLERFEEEYDHSLIERKFTLDTTRTGAEETLQGFLQGVWPHLAPIDQLRKATRP